jgi:hypothetical protein
LKRVREVLDHEREHAMTLGREVELRYQADLAVADELEHVRSELKHAQTELKAERDKSTDATFKVNAWS